MKLALRCLLEWCRPEKIRKLDAQTLGPGPKVLKITRHHDGHYILAYSSIGPFADRREATRLAERMAATLNRDFGGDVSVVQEYASSVAAQDQPCSIEPPPAPTARARN